MQKRVGLARAIATDPAVIFFDEPTAGLDPILAGVINELIRELVTEMGATAVTITHDMTTVRTVADHVAMLHGGLVRWQGPIEEMDASPDPYLDQFIHGRAEGPIAAVRLTGSGWAARPRQAGQAAFRPHLACGQFTPRGDSGGPRWPAGGRMTRRPAFTCTACGASPCQMVRAAATPAARGTRSPRKPRPRRRPRRAHPRPRPRPAHRARRPRRPRSRRSPRALSGIAELDRVLGGGLVPASAILVGGDPGIGKSTLLLQAAAAFAVARRRGRLHLRRGGHRPDPPARQPPRPRRRAAQARHRDQPPRHPDHARGRAPGPRRHRLDPDHVGRPRRQRARARSPRSAPPPTSSSPSPSAAAPRSSSSATSPRTARSPARASSSTWSTPCSTSRASAATSSASCARSRTASAPPTRSASSR